MERGIFFWQDATASRLVDVRRRWRPLPACLPACLPASDCWLCFCAISVTPGALSLLTLVTRPARDISLPLFVREGEGGGSSTAGGLLAILRRLLGEVPKFADRRSEVGHLTCGHIKVKFACRPTSVKGRSRDHAPGAWTDKEMYNVAGWRKSKTTNADVVYRLYSNATFDNPSTHRAYTVFVGTFLKLWKEIHRGRR